MASIQKRGNSYNVVYYYRDDNGEQHQKCETFSTKGEAYQRKIQIESQMNDKTFVPP